MTAIDSSLFTTNNTSSSTATSASQQIAPQTLSQGDFLKLMTAQLQAQDPLKPLDNSQFVSQMAQFSTVSGIQNMQDSISKLAASLSATSMLQGAALVGHNVLVPSSTADLGASGSVSGAIDVPASGTLLVNITDASGQVLRQINMGSQPAGLTNFTWDGNDNGGARVAAGSYKISALVQNGQQTQAATPYVVAPVLSVATDGSSGLNVNVQGLGSVGLSSIRQIQ